MSLLTELKRRNVFRAGGAYLVAVWIVLQVTDVVAPALGLPGWVLTAEIVLGAVAYLLTDKLFLTETSADWLPDGRRSIAVLPFENCV
jgi:hypothetical protein